MTLGDLRNLSIQKSRGDYFCQWDDDDWYREDRLRIQLAAVEESEKCACVLSRLTALDVGSQQVFVTRQRGWEGSLLCEKSQFKRYPSLNRGEDTIAIAALRLEEKLLLLDRPEVYVYTLHSGNVWGRPHRGHVLRGAEKLSEEEREKVIAAIHLGNS